MEYWDVRILTGSYSVEDNAPVIELFGKTRDNKSITVRYKGFLPYFHVLGQKDEVTIDLGEDPDIRKIEEISLFHNGRKNIATKVTVSIPATVPKYRSDLQQKNYTVMAADIPFQHRFIYDKNLGSCVRVFGTKIDSEKFTTDLVIEAEKFEDCEPFKPDLKIFSFDIENSLKDGHIFTICCAVSFKGKLVDLKLIGDEKKIISNWIDAIQDHDPDIITGYNIDGYDLPTIINRANMVGIRDLPLGRNLKNLKSISGRFWRLPGRIIADAWWNVKKEVKLKKETLNHVSNVLLGETKDDVDPKKIDEEWANDKDKVINYCLRDAELALRILVKIKALGKAMDLATVSKLPLDDAINGRTSTFIDSILIREADRANVAVPLSGSKKEIEKIEGGYVHEFDAGLYDMVCVLDFKSMYPSIIIANNICFTTISPEGTIISPIRVRFLDPQLREGLVPKVLKKLMVDRELFKSNMKEAKKNGNREAFEYYKGLQEAVKVLMNAIYGVFASSFYRFTNRDIGSSITAFARQSVQELIKMLEDEGYKVIYSDTDSVFFKSEKTDTSEAVKLGEKIANKYSTGGTILEFEQILNPLFSHGKKKRYVGKIVWPEEGKIIRGYEIRRTDSFDLQSTALDTIFDEILDRNPDGAVVIAKNIINDIKNGKVKKEQLVISRTVKEEKYYVNPDRMVNVRIARKLKEMGYEFVPGMKVSWIVTNSKVSPQEAEPYIDGRDFTLEPDWDYYARRVAMTLSRVIEDVGGDIKTLLGEEEKKKKTKKKNHTLMDFDDLSKKEDKEINKPIKTDKEIKIEDFF
jgi:DNA polymerase I